MASRLIVTAILALGLGAAGVVEAAHSRSVVARFQTPSRNIACLYSSPLTGGGPALLRCDIRSGLKPEPQRACELDWTGLTVQRRGRSEPVCAGDTVLGARVPVLRYGRTWSRGGFTCRSRRTGLRCTNRSGRGFVLARERWRLF